LLNVTVIVAARVEQAFFVLHLNGFSRAFIHKDVIVISTDDDTLEAPKRQNVSAI
jgi:hypothetical protein